jgi:hypothetical protein
MAVPVELSAYLTNPLPSTWDAGPACAVQPRSRRVIETNGGVLSSIDTIA